jgi:hypothetical protein
MVERRDIVWNVIALVVRSREPVIVFSGQVDDLEILGGEKRGGFEKELIDPARALASAGHKKRGPRGIEIENFESLVAWNGAAEIFSNWRASDDAGSTGEMRTAVLETK